jgi:hypothetical protein
MSVADIIKSGPDIPLSRLDFIMSFNDLTRSALEIRRSAADFPDGGQDSVKKGDTRNSKSEILRAEMLK